MSAPIQGNQNNQGLLGIASQEVPCTNRVSEAVSNTSISCALVASPHFDAILDEHPREIRPVPEVTQQFNDQLIEDILHAQAMEFKKLASRIVDRAKEIMNDNSYDNPVTTTLSHTSHINGTSKSPREKKK